MLHGVNNSRINKFETEVMFYSLKRSFFEWENTVMCMLSNNAQGCWCSTWKLPTEGLYHEELKFVIYANLVILAAFNTYYQCIVGESWTLRWLRSLLDKMDLSVMFIHCYLSMEYLRNWWHLCVMMTENIDHRRWSKEDALLRRAKHLRNVFSLFLSLFYYFSLVQIDRLNLKDNGRSSNQGT